MWDFVLTYDAPKDVLNDVVEVLCDNGIKKIGHPVESTLVFESADKENTVVEKLASALKKKFLKDFDFVLSRVSAGKNKNGDIVDQIADRVDPKAHENPFDDVLKKLKEAGKITDDVKNFKAPF